MPDYDGIKQRIDAFTGYDTEEARRRADEQIRAYAGERLAAVPSDALEKLDADTREQYDRALLHCEFLNQQAFVTFEGDATPEQIQAVLNADVQLLDAADRLSGGDIASAVAEIERSFANRNAAMAGT